MARGERRKTDPSSGAYDLRPERYSLTRKPGPQVGLEEAHYGFKLRTLPNCKLLKTPRLRNVVWESLAVL